MQMPKLLLVEDNMDLGDILRQYLREHGFRVSWSVNAEDGLKILNTTNFNLCILDVALPDKDGFKLAEEIHKIKPEIPFIFLTARQSREDRIKGLKLMADDYITKPFDVEELIMRIKNILRRVQGTEPQLIFSIGTYQFSYDNYLLTHDRSQYKLTQHEAELLKYLFENRNKLMKRKDILNAVWGESDFFHGRSMDVYITRLRKYFSEDPGILIKSTRGVGISFRYKT